MSQRWGMDFDSAEAEVFLGRLKHKAETPMGKALIRAGSPVVAEAKRLAPKDTRGLTLSINAAVDESGARHTLFVGTPLQHGLFQCLGFRHWKSGEWIERPYLRPAIHAKRGEVQANLKAEVQKWLLS